jgi:NTE family protein
MSNNRVYKYLVIGGGGASGIAVAGAIDQLAKTPEFSFDNIEAVAGTSVGAIAAIMVSLNYTPNEILETIASINLKSLEDGGCPPTELYRLLTEYGIYKGDALYDIIKNIIKEKTGRNDPENVTFADLKKLGCKDLYIVTTKIYELNGNPTGKKKVFSIEKHADTPVAPIVHASAAAPLFFASIPLKKIASRRYLLDKEGDLFADGGLSNNYDITIFDQPQFMPQNLHDHCTVNPQTLGIALLNTNQIIDKNHKPVKSRITNKHPFEFFYGVINTILKEFEDAGIDNPQNRKRTIQIDRKGVQLGDFNKVQNNPTLKAALLESGREAVKTYFSIPHEEQVVYTLDSKLK